MKKFDLEAAKAGAKVCTRDEREVRIICFDANTKNCDAIAQLDREGNPIKEFHSIRSAGRETGIDPGNINLVCNGKRLNAGGYKWKKIN